MKHDFNQTTPMLRLVFAVVALSITLALGGFIDVLSLGYAFVADVLPRPILIADATFAVDLRLPLGSETRRYL